MRPSFMLDSTVDLIARTALVFSLYLLFTGHNYPGGGFVGGLVVVVILMLRLSTSGVGAVRSLAWLRPQLLLGCGLMLAFLTGMAGWLWGDTFLAGASVSWDLPVFGSVKVTSALVLDIGVYLVVTGVGGGFLIALGGLDGTRLDENSELVTNPDQESGR